MANQKTIGLGTASLLILALGFLFNFKFADGFMVSHYLFQQLNLSVYSNGETGFHYPFAAAIIFGCRLFFYLESFRRIMELRYLTK